MYESKTCIIVEVKTIACNYAFELPIRAYSYLHTHLGIIRSVNFYNNTQVVCLNVHIEMSLDF